MSFNKNDLNLIYKIRTLMIDQIVHIIAQLNKLDYIKK